MRVAVLGGGPAGAMAAERLAASGVETLLVDEKLAWEKPCGGGLTYKAYERYPFLRENRVAKRTITESYLADPAAGRVRMDLDRPMLIYSRRDLNQLLLDRAEAAGARIEKTRVTGLTRRERGWSLATKTGAIEADFLIAANGARNTLRAVGTEWRPQDVMVAIGYHLPLDQAHVTVQFYPEFEGYLWEFPRCGHSSVGICGRATATELKARLHGYLSERGWSYKDAPFYAHAIPSLDREGFQRNRVAGDGWLAVGDAAALVDPVTGEGIYYALRSGELAAQALLEWRPAGAPAAYRAAIEQDFLADLTYAAGLAKRFFLQRVLNSTVPGKMIDFMRKSPRLRAVVQDLFAGTQDYLSLKPRLLAAMKGSTWEVLLATLGVTRPQEVKG